MFLAVELADTEQSRFSESAFMAWFWRTSWSEVFGSSSYRQVRAEQENLRNALAVDLDVQWTRDQGIPARFDSRSARVRLFTLRLTSRSDLLDEMGQLVDGRQLLVIHGRDSFKRLFPTPQNATPSLRKLLQGGGNRFLVAPSKEVSLRERLRVGPDLSVETLESHFINEDAIVALRNGNLEGFIKRRAESMELWDLAQWDAERHQSTLL